MKLASIVPAVAALLLASVAQTDDALGKGGGSRSGGSHGSSRGGSSLGRSGSSLGGSSPSRTSPTRISSGRTSSSRVSSSVGRGFPTAGSASRVVSRPSVEKIQRRPIESVRRPPVADAKKTPKPSHHGNQHHGNHHDNHHGHHHDNHHGNHHGHHHGHHAHHCPPIRIWLPSCAPVIRKEVVVVEEVLVPAVPAAAPVAAAVAAAPANAAEATKDETPAAVPTVPVGATLTLEGSDLGQKQGRVVLQIGAVSMPATVEKWEAKSAMATLPVVGLTEATAAAVHIYAADSKLVNTIAIQLVPASDSPQPQAGDAQPATADANEEGESAVRQAQVAAN